MIGFNSPSYFAKCFQQQFGVLPKDFQDKQMNEMKVASFDSYFTLD